MARQNLQRFIISMRLVERRLERQSSKLKKEEFKMAEKVRYAIETDDMDAANLFPKDIARNRHIEERILLIAGGYLSDIDVPTAQLL